MCLVTFEENGFERGKYKNASEYINSHVFYVKDLSSVKYFF